MVMCVVELKKIKRQLLRNVVHSKTYLRVESYIAYFKYSYLIIFTVHLIGILLGKVLKQGQIGLLHGICCC